MIDILTEAHFISHCENEGCDLGSFVYTCIHCKNPSYDYEIWWDQDDIWSGKVISFSCEKCQGDLSVYYNKNINEYLIK